MHKNPEYAFDFSPFQEYRHTFVPKAPATISDPLTTKIAIKRSQDMAVKSELNAIFPKLLENGMKLVELEIDNENGQILRAEQPLKIGCVLSGGQAAGGHNVIMGLFDMVK
jgi:hypothetical protein